MSSGEDGSSSDSAEPYVNRARVLLNDNKLVEAVNLLERAGETYPESRKIQSLLRKSKERKAKKKERRERLLKESENPTRTVASFSSIDCPQGGFSADEWWKRRHTVTITDVSIKFYEVHLIRDAEEREIGFWNLREIEKGEKSVTNWDIDPEEQKGTLKSKDFPYAVVNSG
jgi:hypothetical protein